MGAEENELVERLLSVNSAMAEAEASEPAEKNALKLI